MKRYTWNQLAANAEKDLRECVNELNSHVVGSAIRHAEQDLADRRHREDPLGQAVDQALAQGPSDARGLISSGGAE